MPRLPQSAYVRIHDQLRRFWLANNRLFAELTTTEQTYLHDYYQPAKQCSRDELLAHRRIISAERPDFPAKAGRAYAKFRDRAATHALNAVRASRDQDRLLRVTPKQRRQAVRVKAIVKPFDVDAWAQIIYLMAQRELKDEY